MLRVVVDTSVLIAGLLSKDELSGPSRVVANWYLNRFHLVMSPQLLNEFVIISTRRQISAVKVETFVDDVRRKALLIPGQFEATRLDDIDPADNKVLAAAYESRADYLVSLDKYHLLPLKHFHGTQILIPTLFLRCIGG